MFPGRWFPPRWFSGDYYNRGITAGVVELTPSTGAVIAGGVAPTLASALSPTTGTVVLTGFAPTISVTLAGVTGAVTAAGETPSLLHVLPASTGAVVTAGASPSLAAILAPAPAPVVATGFPAAVTSTLAGVSGAAVVDGNPPTVTQLELITLAPDTGPVVAAGEVPSLVSTLAPSTGAISADGILVSRAVVLNPTTAPVTFAGEAPALSVLTTIDIAPSAGAIDAAGSPPSLASIMAPAQGAALVAGETASLTSALAATTGTISVDGNAPSLTVLLLIDVAPSTGAVLAAGTSTSLAFGIGAIEGTVTAAGYEPALVTSLLPSTGIISADGNAPGFGGQVSIAPATGTVTALGNALSLSTQLVTSSAAITAAGYPPTLSTDIPAVTGSITAAGNPPSVSTTVVLSGVTGTASVLGNTPQVIIAGIIILEPATPGAVAVVGYEPFIPVVTKLHPDVIIASTNLSGVVANIDEDPTSADASWLTATSATAATDLRVGFEDPPPISNPIGTQRFLSWLRKTAGTPNPTATIELWQNGSVVWPLVENVSITSTTGQLVDAQWQAAGLNPGRVWVYCGTEPDYLPAFEQWLGRPVGGHTLFGNQDSTWTELLNSVNWLEDLWADWYRPVLWSVPLIVAGEVPAATLEDAASGAYNTYYDTLAATIAEHRPQDAEIIIRPGWEFNGDWMPWASLGKEAAYKTAFQNLVNRFRLASSRFRFNWCPSIGQNNPEASYPGDGYVDNIGMDAYYNTDYYSTNGATAFNTQKTESYGLEWHVAFAAAHGKPISYPEWGINNDSPEYMQLIHDWFVSNNVAYQGYWNSDAAFTGLLSHYPNAAAKYKELFSRWQDTAPDGTDVQYRIVSTPGSTTGPGALPAYSSTGQAGAATNATITATITPAIPSTCNAGDLLILQVLARNTDNGGDGAGPATITDWTEFAGNPYGGTNNSRQSLYWRIATAGLAGTTVSVTCSGGVTADLAMARIYRFTAADGFAATPIEGITTNAGTASPMAAPVTGATPGGTNRCAVCLGAIASSDAAVGNMTGETAGDWTEATNANTTLGGDGTLNVQVADASAGTAISGGSIAFTPTTSAHWNTVAFYLVPLTVSTNVNTVEIGAVEWDAQFGPRTVTLAVSTGAVSLVGNAPSISTTLLGVTGTASITGQSPSLAVVLTPDTAPVTVTGYSPSMGGQITPATGSVSAAGSAASITTTLQVQSGAFLLAGQDPSLSTAFAPGTGAVAITGYVPDVSYTGQIAPSTGVVTAAGSVPSLVTTLQPQTGTFSVTGQAPARNVYREIAPSAGAINLDGNIPGLPRDIRLDAVTGAAVVSGEAPAIANILVPSSGAVDASGIAPTVRTLVEIAPASAIISISGNAPAFIATLIPGDGNVSATGYVPEVLQVRLVDPETGVVTVSGEAPEWTLTRYLEPPTGIVAFIGNAAALQRIIPSMPMGDYVILIEADERTIVIAAEDRTIIVPAEERSVLATVEERQQEAA